mgnify:CR=1 FL=1
MKKIIYICILSLLLPSCDLLKEDPTTRLLEGEAFDTKPALEAQMNGIYGTLTSTFFSSHWFYYFNCASHLVHWKSTRSGLLIEQALRGTLYADQNTGRGIMTSIYSTINKCNILLDGLESSPVEQAYKDKIAAETKMIRGMMYFYLVRLFGDVPLHLKQVTRDTDAYIKRTSYLEVYKQILEDLDYAFTYMPAAAEMPAENIASGRPHKYAAKAFQAQVYLQIASLLASPDDQAFGTIESGEVKPDFAFIDIDSPETAWRLALDAADEVISSGAYELEADYRNVFNWDPTKPGNAFFSKEKILAIQMTPNGGSSTASLYTLPGYMVGTQNAESLTHASNPGMIRPSRYVFQRWARTYGGSTRQDKDTGDKFYTTCDDPRLDASYIYNEYYAAADDKGKRYDTPKKVTIYPAKNGSDQCYFKKYFFPQFDQDAGYADFHLIRLPEMYFIAAEACAQLGVSGVKGDAYDYIEVLHSRARASADTPSEQPKWDKGQFASAEELVTAIFWERVYEMGGEGHEWFDSHRHGARWILDNVYEPMHQFLLEQEQVEYKKTYWYGRGYELPRTLDNVRNCLICDYPKYELLYNQALTSNDQNYFNSSKATFSVSGGGASNNENYDEEITLPW